MKELSWNSYDEKETVFKVKKARAGEQLQLNIERIKAEIKAQNEKIAEENKENLNKSIQNNRVENDEIENIEVDEEIDEIEDNMSDEDSVEKEILEDNTEQSSSETNNDNNIDPFWERGDKAEENFNNKEEKKLSYLDSSFQKEAQGIDMPIDSSLHSEWQTNSENEEIFVITSENLPFSKMKQLMTIVSWNPWDITIQVLWNEMKVSEKWVNELKNLIQE